MLSLKLNCLQARNEFHKRNLQLQSLLSQIMGFKLLLGEVSTASGYYKTRFKFHVETKHDVNDSSNANWEATQSFKEVSCLVSPLSCHTQYFCTNLF